jgi:hypothetical protein
MFMFGAFLVLSVSWEFHGNSFKLAEILHKDVIFSYLHASILIHRRES